MDIQKLRNSMQKLPAKDRKLYFVYIPVAVIIISISFVVKSIREEQTVDEELQQTAIFLPEVGGDDTGYASKSDAYKELLRKQKEKRRTNELMKESDFFGFDANDAEEAEPDSCAQQRRTSYGRVNTEENIEPASEITKPRTKKEIVYVYRERTPKTEEKTVEAVPPPPNDPAGYSGMGVYQAGAASDSEIGNRFLVAVLEEDKKLRANSQLTFIAMDELATEEGIIAKQSLLFGFVTFKQDRIEVEINKIQNADGTVTAVHLIGYNENYQRGIRYEGRVDKAMQRGSNSAVNSASEVASSAAGRLAGSVIRSTSDVFQKQPEIFVGKGYRMYFKEGS